ncbi:MAG: hypothetical protein ACFCU8_06980 [Thermosynechococcaceae cyanobacterium]
MDWLRWVSYPGKPVTQSYAQ